MCHCTTKCLLITSVLIAALAFIFVAYPWQYRLRLIKPPPVSYDGRIHFNFKNLRTPRSHKDIEDIVKEAYGAVPPRKIRVLAAGHSWSQIAQTQDIMISLNEYQGIINLDEKKMEVTVKAGTTLRSMSESLDNKGYAMIQLGSVAGQSIAGAISTGTHGTGLTVGNLASLVTKLKFVSGTGETVTVSEGDDDFEAAAVSIGMFGVISEVTLRVEKAFKLKEHRYRKSLDHCIDNLNELVHKAKYVKFWVEFYNKLCVVYETEKVPNDTPNEGEEFLFPFLTYYTFAVSTRITYLFPQFTPWVMALVGFVGFSIPTTRVANSYLIFNDYFELPVHQESEITVPYNESAELLKAIRDVVIENQFPVNYITEVRFVKGDDNWLSPEYRMDEGTCAVTLTIYGPEDTVNDYFDAVYEKFEGRIHWGKYFPSTVGRSTFEEWYEKFGDFEELRKKYDPKDIFINRFLKLRFLE